MSDLGAIRARHKNREGWCEFCSSAYVFQPYPCDTVIVLEALDKVTKELDAALMDLDHAESSVTPDEIFTDADDGYVRSSVTPSGQSRPPR
jgi:hypothetical protein